MISHDFVGQSKPAFTSTLIIKCRKAEEEKEADGGRGHFQEARPDGQRHYQDGRQEEQEIERKEKI